MSLSVTTTHTEQISLVDLGSQRRRLGDRIEGALHRVLDHGAFIMGPEVATLEQQLAAHCGVRHAVACSSGTDALVLALLALGIGSADAVLVPSFTFAATAEAVAIVGATPVLVDVLPDTYCIDVHSTEAAVVSARHSGLTPRAVIAVDLFGQPADYAGLSALCTDQGLHLIADAAQSFGASWCGRSVGTLADVSTTSFFPAKPLGCYGDGGAVFTADERIDASLRSLRAHGQGSERYENDRVGLNGRMDTLQAAVLIEKLTIFDDEIDSRRRIAERYRNGLADLVGLQVLNDPAKSTWAQFTVLTDNRDDVRAGLQAVGVPTAVHYPLAVHQQAAYRRFPTAPGGLPVSELLAGRIMSLPLHPYLTADMQERVVGAVRETVTALA